MPSIQMPLGARMVQIQVQEAGGLVQGMPKDRQIEHEELLSAGVTNQAPGEVSELGRPFQEGQARDEPEPNQPGGNRRPVPAAVRPNSEQLQEFLRPQC